MDGFARLAFALVIFIIALRKLSHGLLAICLTIAWWEIPTLKWGLTNQFLIESGVIGFLLASALKQRKTPIELSTVARQPFVPFFIYAIAFSLISIPISWGYWSAQIPKAELYGAFKYIVPRLADWNSQDMFSHSWSLLFGFAVHTSLVGEIIRSRRRAENQQRGNENLSLEQVLSAIVVGSIPVVTYATMQKFQVVQIIFSPDFGGTLQNGNHLSFFSALVFIFSVYLLTIPKSSRPLHKSVFFVTLLTSLVGILIGRGRSTWIGLGVVGLACGIKFIFRFLADADFRLSTSRIKSLGVAVVFIGLFALLALQLLGESEERLVRQLWILMSEGRWSELIMVSGRSQAYEVAVSALLENLATGIGLGNFFSQAALGVDLHNIYLLLLVEFGFFALVPFYFMLKSAVPLFRPNATITAAQRNMVIAVALLCSVVGLGDVPFLYRSLLLILTVLFAMLVSTRSHQESERGSLKFMVSFGVFAGLLTLLSPHVKHQVMGPFPANDLSWIEVNMLGVKHQCALLPPLPSSVSGSKLMATMLPSAIGEWDVDRNITADVPTVEDEYISHVPNGGPFELCVCTDVKSAGMYLRLKILSRTLFVPPLSGVKNYLVGRESVSDNALACDDYILATTRELGEKI